MMDTKGLSFVGAIVILFFFALIGIFVTLILIELPFIQIIWEQSGGTITRGDFMTFMFTAFILMAFILIILKIWFGR